MTVRDSTTDSYFSDQLVFPRPIPISTNNSTPTTDSFLNDGFLLQNYGLDPPDSFKHMVTVALKHEKIKKYPQRLEL